MTDAWGCAELIRSGAVTAVSVVRAAVERAEADGNNAFTIVTGDSALAQAAEVDSGVRTGPLAGVPISVKDHVWLAGLPATNGSRALADFVPTETAVCVSRLIDAGAIVIGKTTNPEFCYRGITESDLFGVTSNPRDPTRTTGGSSGGAAASVAAEIVPLAVGTDGGGSIRIPAAFCGVYGLKPSFGLVPKLPGFRGWPTLSVTGPLAESVRDLALALDVMAGPHAADWLSFPGGSDYRGAVTDPTWDGLRVGYCTDFAPVDDDVRDAFAAALGAMGTAGAALVEADVPRDDCLSMWESIALPEGYASEGPVVEAHRDLVGDDAAEITLSGKGISARQYLDSQDARMDYARRWAEVFDHVDVLLMPNMPTTAFPIGALRPDTIAGQPVPDGYDIWCASMPPANLAGLPAASVPIGVGADGLPVAAQVMGARWTDATVLRAAALLDAAIGNQSG